MLACLLKRNAHPTWPHDASAAAVVVCLQAPLPKDTIRTVYLCDDGKDPTKEEMVRELNAEWGCLEYVSGRKRDPNGECCAATRPEMASLTCSSGVGLKRLGCLLLLVVLWTWWLAA